MDNGLLNGFALQPVPALIGAFIGAPLLARELETGTFRYAWTQGFGRVRWTLAKLVALAIVLAAAAGAFSLVISWYFRPYFQTGNRTLALSEVSPLNPGLFDLRGVGLAAWTLAAFAIGGLAGMLIRRVLPAVVATLASYTGLAFATGLYFRQHYLTPLVSDSPDQWVWPGSAWVISERWVTKGGRPVSQSMLGKVLQGAPPSVAGKGGGVPRASELGTVPRAARLHAVDRLPAGHPVLVVPVHGSGMPSCPLRPPGRRHDLARPSTAVLNIGPFNHPRITANPETLWATPRHRPFAQTRGGFGAPRC